MIRIDEEVDFRRECVYTGTIEEVDVDANPYTVDVVVLWGVNVDTDDFTGWTGDGGIISSARYVRAEFDNFAV